ncbi:MAG: hypothetical protein IKK77_06275 [Clostridia bacterium]|nr:hypothetical protein [Clostridia bacterium]
MASIKLDVIYYKTQSDFEFEFNLSGCAGVRLFKEKIETPKALVTSLARDVARSRVIIVVADLTDENGGVSVISKAIGLPLVAVEKETYNIASEGDCNLFKGATPLVTKNGVFVGFIAESGPQSIIVLTSNRALRHEIMDSYVHKYIFEVAQLEAYNEKYKAPVIAESETVENEVSEKKETEPEIIPIDLAPGTSINPLPFVKDEEDDENEEDEKQLNKRLNQKGNGLNIALLVIVVLLLIGFGVLAYLFIYIPLLNGEAPFLSEGIKYFLRR